MEKRQQIKPDKNIDSETSGTSETSIRHSNGGVTRQENG
jgi:hypothetical protein